MGTRVVWWNCRRCHIGRVDCGPTEFIQLHRVRCACDSSTSSSSSSSVHFRRCNFSGFVATSYLKIYNIFWVCAMCVCFFFVFSSTFFFSAANEVRTQFSENYIKFVFAFSLVFSLSLHRAAVPRKDECAAHHIFPTVWCCFFFRARGRAVVRLFVSVWISLRAQSTSLKRCVS